LEIKITIGSTEIANINANSVYINGESTFKKWRVCSKINYAIGRTSGDRNIIDTRLNVINDSDLVDLAVNRKNTGSAGKFGY